jgi:DNA polymerase elongation subunit (family B)
MDLKNKSLDELEQMKRKLVKEIDKYDNWQNAKKVTLNSAYGAMGSEYFRFYDVRLASAVTLSGQLVIQWIAQYVNDYLNNTLKTKNEDYIIAMDTDSIYICLDKMVQKIIKDQDTNKIINFLDAVCEERIQEVINTACYEVFKYTNGFRQKMNMKRECLADRGVWTRKKRYALNAYDIEGVRYDPPYIKIMGLEAIKTSTPSSCRTALKEALKIIMTKTNDDLVDFIDKFREEFLELPLGNIGAPTSINGVEKYRSNIGVYTKDAPGHHRAALRYNALLKERNLEEKYDLITSGDKIKILRLKRENPWNENNIAFHLEMPPELDVEKYIDKLAQFEKVFLNPVRNIINVIGWTERKVNTLW